MIRARPWGGLLLPVLLAAPAALADAHLVLRDGQVLSGSSVELQGDLYLLSLETGDVLPFPVALVSEVHRSAEANPPAKDDEEPGELPILEMEIVPVQTREVPPEDIGVVERPRRTIELPDGGRGVSEFSRSLVDPHWMPDSGYSEKPMLGLFDTPFWADGPIDPNWNDESGFELPEGVPAFRLDKWNPASQRSIWKPKEGFADGDDN